MWRTSNFQDALAGPSPPLNEKALSTRAPTGNLVRAWQARWCRAAAQESRATKRSAALGPYRAIVAPSCWPIGPYSYDYVYNTTARGGNGRQAAWILNDRNSIGATGAVGTPGNLSDAMVAAAEVHLNPTLSRRGLAPNPCNNRIPIGGAT